MNSVAFSCPVCGSALARLGGALRCSKGHSFDVARDGHVNLLLSNRMHTKSPGDSKEMVAARRRLLNSGTYEPFAAKLSELCCNTTHRGRLHIADAGCGEGYYDAHLAAALAQKHMEYTLCGIDISKRAVRSAARRRIENAHFAVASSFAMPLQNNWAHLLLNVFSPLAHTEFLRVLAPGGRLIYAVPTEDHLLGLKELLYAQVYENPRHDTTYPGFTQIDEATVETQVSLNGPLVQDLFAMTPYYWRTPAQGAKVLAATQQLTTPVGFRFLVFQKDL